jgi:transposase InsO family protein
MRSTCDSSIHSSLGYLTPAEFESQWREQQVWQTNIH